MSKRRPESTLGGSLARLGPDGAGRPRQTPEREEFRKVTIPVKLTRTATVVSLAAVALVIGACSGDESGDDQETRSASADSYEWKPANWDKNPGTAVTLINKTNKPIGFSCAQAPKASQIASPLFSVQPGGFKVCLTAEFIPENSAPTAKVPAISAVHLNGGSKTVKFWADGLWDRESANERALFGFFQSCFGNEAYRAENSNTIFGGGWKTFECAGLDPIAVSFDGVFGKSNEQSGRTGQIRMAVG